MWDHRHSSSVSQPGDRPAGNRVGVGADLGGGGNSLVSIRLFPLPDGANGSTKGTAAEMDLLKHFTDNIGDLLTTAERLIVQESPSEDPAAVSRSAANLAEEGTRVLGVEPELLVIGGFSHLRWRLGGGARKMLLLGHHDTVWPIGTLERIPFRVDSGVMRGPGCFDMKIGVAMMLHAAAALPDCDGITILVTGDEETGSATSRALIEEEASAHNAVLVFEAAADGGAIKTARKGVSQYYVTVKGRASHAGLDPEAGINATLELAHQVIRISEMGDAAAGTTVTPTVARAGSTGNTVPAEGLFEVDARAWTADEQFRVDAAMRALEAVLPGAELVIDGEVNRLPMEATVSEDLFATAKAAAGRLGLPAPAGVAVGGASDGNFTAALGVPTLDGLGATGGGAHADSEHVIVGDLPARTALAAEIIRSLCENNPDG